VAALQNYFAEVGKLLIEQPSRQASPDDNLTKVVRAQTLAALELLDPNRKRILLQFLYDSDVISKDKPVVSLLAANLREARLSEARLGEANLKGADLSGANLHKVNLKGADLSEANLKGAAGITNEELEQMAYSLEGTIMPDGSKHP
jgi:hypothetical protein